MTASIASRVSQPHAYFPAMSEIDLSKSKKTHTTLCPTLDMADTIARSTHVKAYGRDKVSEKPQKTSSKHTTLEYFLAAIAISGFLTAIASAVVTMMIYGCVKKSTDIAVAQRAEDSEKNRKETEKIDADLGHYTDTLHGYTQAFQNYADKFDAYNQKRDKRQNENSASTVSA